MISTALPDFAAARGEGDRRLAEALGPQVRLREPLANRTTLGVGGPARFFFEPATAEEAARLFRRLRSEGIAVRVLGGGANLLIDDAGVDGAVLSTKRLQAIERRPEGLRVEAGVPLPKLVQWAAGRGLKGLEPLVGVPGTVGGAVTMNAGGRHGCFAEAVGVVEFATPEGDLVRRRREEVPFRYRSCGLRGFLFLAAELTLPPDDPRRVQGRVRDILREKEASQPLKTRSAGCIFKNPPGASAGRLLEQAGLKGTREGGAAISERHANFIVNLGGATSADVRALVGTARERVRDLFGVELEMEVVEWGQRREAT